MLYVRVALSQGAQRFPRAKINKRFEIANTIARNTIIDMKMLTPQEREALMADMRSFFEDGLFDETLSDEETSDGEHWELGHCLSGDMSR